MRQPKETLGKSATRDRISWAIARIDGDQAIIDHNRAHGVYGVRDRLDDRVVLPLLRKFIRVMDPINEKHNND